MNQNHQWNPHGLPEGYLYIQDEKILGIEEDSLHEFKGHLCLVDDEIPICCKPEHGHATRAPISKTLCGFLNTGKGGVVYIGILDGGTIKGIPMSALMLDHFLISLDNCLANFYPPVPKYLYDLRIFKVFTYDELKETDVFPKLSDPDKELRTKFHNIRDPINLCFCYHDFIAQGKCGKIHTAYILEVHIKKWNSSNPMAFSLGCGLSKTHPYFINEEGGCFMRYHASVVKLDLDELKHFTLQDVDTFFDTLFKSICREDKKQLMLDLLRNDEYQHMLMEEYPNVTPLHIANAMELCSGSDLLEQNST